MKLTEILKEDDAQFGGSNIQPERVAIGHLKNAYKLMMSGKYAQASKEAERAAFILGQIDQNGAF